MRTLAAISLLLIVGLLLNASMLVYAAYVLAATFWLSRYLTQRWTENLSGMRKMSRHEMEIGETVDVAIRLDNKGSLRILWVLIDDLLPRSAVEPPHPSLEITSSSKAAGQPLRLCSVPSKSSRLMAYKLTSLRRGYFQIGPTIAETGDLFGLHRRFRALTRPSYLLVLPRLIPLAGYDIASRRPVGEVNVTYRLMEDPTMISGIRAYQNGDPMRSIHWRATARTGELQCKQYQPTSVAGATLVLDFHTESNPDRHEPVRTDLAVTAAASICHTLLNLQQQFGLISNGRDAADRFQDTLRDGEFESMETARNSSRMKESSDRLKPVVLPATRGYEHFSQIHRTLARLERTDGMRLEQLLIESQSRMPRDATVIVILQQVTEEAALALGLLRRQGYSVSAIVNNYENEAFHEAVGRLLAQRIVVYHLVDQDSIPQICKELILRY